MMDYLSRYKRYILLEQGLSENTRMAYERDVERFLTWLTPSASQAGGAGCDASGEDMMTDVVDPSPAQGTGGIVDVTLETFHDYTHDLYELGIAPRSIARMLSGVRSFYRFLQLDGVIAQDPTELLESPRVPKHLPEVLTLDEVDRILAAINLEMPEGQRDHCMIELLYSCGLRVSEICSLKISDLFIEEGFIRVTGKGDKQRIVPISPRAVRELEYWFDVRRDIDVKPEDEDVVFVSARRGRHLSRITVFHNIKQYVAAAEIGKDVSPHTFRHTFATHLLEGGASLRAIQEMLGHENIGTTEIYTHLDRRFLREQVLAHFPRNQKLS